MSVPLLAYFLSSESLLLFHHYHLLHPPHHQHLLITTSLHCFTGKHCAELTWRYTCYNKRKMPLASLIDIMPLYKLKYSTRRHSVVLIENTNWHGEVLPGLAKYFIDLGYNVDVVLTKNLNRMKPFSNYRDKKIRFFALVRVASDIQNYIKTHKCIVVTTTMSMGGVDLLKTLKTSNSRF